MSNRISVPQEQHYMDEEGYTGLRRRASLIVLLLVNLLPLAGVLWLGWDVAGLLVLYWSENLILGFYTILKMLSKSPRGGLPLSLFFCLHYGGFCAAHGMFILSILLEVDVDPQPEDPWPLFLVFPQLFINVVKQVMVHAPVAWLLPFAALFVSHGVSFVFNFLLGGEREEVRLSQLMAAPYSRIFLLHAAIIFGGIATVAMGQPMAMLVILVLLKSALDIKLHLREHQKLVQAAPEQTAGATKVG
jgi:hypothetical protein